jgi:hypothetical protein
MLSHQQRQRRTKQQAEAEDRCQDRPAQALHHHHVAQANELRSTGEGPDVADDLAARRFMLDRNGAPVEADVPVTRHGIFRVFDGEVEQAVGILGCGLLDQRVERQRIELEHGDEAREIDLLAQLKERQGKSIIIRIHSD